jgi:hypothetical protein
MAKRETKRGAPKRAILGIKSPQEQLVTMEDVNNLSSVAADMLAPAEANIREIVSRVEEAFNALGTDALPGTIIPAGSRNNAKEAAEFVLAERLSKLAADRLKKAAEAAEKAGVFGNPEEYRIGDTVMVFSDPSFSISVKMGRPSKMIGREQVEAAAVTFLGKKSVEFLEACFKPRAATKQIIVSVK